VSGVVFEGDLVDQGEEEEEVGEKQHLRRYVFLTTLVAVTLAFFSIMLPMKYATGDYYHVMCILLFIYLFVLLFFFLLFILFIII
jgi:hypothetical protein